MPRRFTKLWKDMTEAEREIRRASFRKRYHSDPEFREKQKARARQWQQEHPAEHVAAVQRSRERKRETEGRGDPCG